MNSMSLRGRRGAREWCCRRARVAAPREGAGRPRPLLGRRLESSRPAVYDIKYSTTARDERVPIFFARSERPYRRAARALELFVCARKQSERIRTNVPRALGGCAGLSALAGGRVRRTSRCQL
ncbi:hypothetical protein EVAR_31701_1 [Eumeta japonica]|uniref:Uncharacterized protein n=1 Tax=Eumeta variegata TaxID=151549 RepID=A0A4C1VS55_EUMVA|nr:hypothetical protein EVAR_31701_1 [Eumeta japonica]